jgi:hypothetical protein
MLFSDVRDSMYLTDGWGLLEVIAPRTDITWTRGARRIAVCLDALTEQLVELSEHELAGYWELQAW